MKKLIRYTSFLVVVAVLLSIPALAAETPRASLFFTRTSTYLEKTTGTTFEVWFDVIATGRMDEVGVSSIKVQRSSDGSNWTTMKTFLKENYSQMTDDDTAGHMACVTYTGTSGYYYRAKVVFYAKNSTGSGEYVMYTSTITVP